MSRSRFAEIIASTAVVFAVAACDEPPAPSPTADSAKADAGVQSPAVGGKMGEVAKSLEQRTMGKPEDLAKQPPVTGIFPEGVADLAHAKGAPPRLELVKEGDGTKVTFQPSAGQVLTFAVQMQTTATGKRTYLVEISPPQLAGKSLEALKAEADAAEGGEKNDKPKPATSAAPATSGSAAPSEPPPSSPSTVVPIAAGTNIPMVASVYAVGGGGRTVDPLATFTFNVTATGAADVVRKASKEPTDPEEAKLRDFELSTLEGLILGMYPGLPGKPIGQGAQWTVADRLKFFGTDVVRYRLYQVGEITDDVMHLGMMIRQYAATSSNDLIKEGTVLRAYDFMAQAEMQISLKSFMPDLAQIAQLQMQANVVPSNAKPDQQIEGENIGIEGKMVLNRVDLSKVTTGPAPGPGGEPEKKGEPKKPAPKPKPAPAPAP